MSTFWHFLGHIRGSKGENRLCLTLKNSENSEQKFRIFFPISTIRLRSVIFCTRSVMFCSGSVTIRAEYGATLGAEWRGPTSRRRDVRRRPLDIYIYISSGRLRTSRLRLVGPRHSAPNVAPYSALIVTEPEQNITDLVQKITDLNLIVDIGKKIRNFCSEFSEFFRVKQSLFSPLDPLIWPKKCQKVLKSHFLPFFQIPDRLLTI